MAIREGQQVDTLPSQLYGVEGSTIRKIAVDANGRVKIAALLPYQGVLATAPSDPGQGWTYINSTDHGYYIYYGATWQLLHTLTPAANVDLTNEDFETLTNEDGETLQREP